MRVEKVEYKVPSLNSFEMTLLDFEKSPQTELLISFEEGLDYDRIEELHQKMGDIKYKIQKYCQTSRKLNVEVFNKGTSLLVKKIEKPFIKAII